jgi:hypothetical protein
MSTNDTTVNQSDLYPGLSTADAQVLIARAVSPDIAAMRGYRSITATDARKAGFSPSQARGGLEIPRHNTQGIIDDLPQLRPHEPRLDEKGRPRKYELPFGARHVLDVTPRSLPHIGDISIPILITESIIKGDALESAVSPDTYCVLSINGVWGWISNGAPISDFRDVRFCEKKNGRIVRRRDVVLLFDSDSVMNPQVATARYQLTQHLERRGARVRFVDVPAKPDGSKQGIDDHLAGGHRLADLLATAYAPKEPTAADFPEDPDDAHGTVIKLRLELADNRRIISGLFQTVLSPHMTPSEKVAYLSTLALAEHKRQDGDDTTELSPAEISDDWRPVPGKGETIAPTNKNGSKPRMSRGKVRPVMRVLVSRGLLPATPRTVTRTHANGTKYNDEVWDVAPVNLAESLAQAATWRPETPTLRKPRTNRGTCPHCNELHPIHRQDTCTGCGSIRSTTIIQPDVEHVAATIADSERIHLRQISGQGVNGATEDNTTTDGLSSDLRYFIGGETSTQLTPVSLTTPAVLSEIAPTPAPMTRNAPLVLSGIARERLPVPNHEAGFRGRGRVLFSCRSDEVQAQILASERAQS